MTNGKVCIAYLHNEHVSHSWHDSIRRMHEYSRTEGNDRIAERPLNIRCSSGRIVPSRNYACTLFLDRTDHEYLMFIDTDMGFEPDAVHRLLAAAEEHDAAIVGGLCFALMESRYDGMGGHRFTIVPTMYKLGKVEDEDSVGGTSFCYYGPYEPDTLTPVAATGAAFILVRRSILEAMRERWGDHWFDQFYDGQGTLVGEDFAFCARALALDVTPLVHTGVETTHHKELWISQQDYIGQNILATVTAIGETPDSLPPFVDIPASLESLARNDHVTDDGMLKLAPDLARLAAIIETTKPDLIIETGTYTGASARWLAGRGPNVISIDVDHARLTAPADGDEEIQFVRGDSADPALFERIREMVRHAHDGAMYPIEPPRVMVILDSYHGAAHVAKEIEMWGSLVTPGCYLVVEDTIFGWAPEALRNMHFTSGTDGSPLDAVAARLVDSAEFVRDIDIERMFPISHNPAGYWLRTDDTAEPVATTNALPFSDVALAARHDPRRLSTSLQSTAPGEVTR